MASAVLPAADVGERDVLHPERLPVDPTGTRAPGSWGMVLLIATEAALFAYLLFSYFYLQSVSTTAWPPGGPPELTLVLPNTAVLLASSGTMWWAERSLRRGRVGALRLGLLLTLALGVTFLSVQAVEYAKLPFRPQSGAYGALFYTITGFHGAHVFVGLVVIAVVLVRAALGHFTAERHLAVTNATWYWHFVDAVWLFVLTSLYFTPRFT